MFSVDFANLLAWLIAHGYFIMFGVMFVEGPVTTIVAGFAAASGNFNIFVVYLLSVLGDISADAVYYLIGYGFRWKIIEKISRYLKIPVWQAETMKHSLSKHPFKTFLGVKFAPFAPAPAFMIVGYTHFSFVKYINYCTIISALRSLAFVILGYFFGQLFFTYRSLQNLDIYLGLGFVIILVIYWLIKKFFIKVVDKIIKE